MFVESEGEFGENEGIDGLQKVFIFLARGNAAQFFIFSFVI